MYWFIFIIWLLNAIFWIIEDYCSPHWSSKLSATLSIINAVLNLIMAIVGG